MYKYKCIYLVVFVYLTNFRTQKQFSKKERLLLISNKYVIMILFAQIKISTTPNINTPRVCVDISASGIKFSIPNGPSGLPG